jgi:hypothetical protein
VSAAFWLFVGRYAGLLKALDVGGFFLFCRFDIAGYKTLVEDVNLPPLAVVEWRVRGYFARIQVAIIREFLCFE